jgi:hypothetical protein
MEFATFWKPAILAAFTRLRVHEIRMLFRTISNPEVATPPALAAFAGA